MGSDVGRHERRSRYLCGDVGDYRRCSRSWNHVQLRPNHGTRDVPSWHVPVIRVRLDAQGNLVWACTWGGNNFETANLNAVAFAGGDDVFLVGYTGSFGAARGSDDVLISRLDGRTGSVLWSTGMPLCQCDYCL